MNLKNQLLLLQLWRDKYIEKNVIPTFELQRTLLRDIEDFFKTYTDVAGVIQNLGDVLEGPMDIRLPRPAMEKSFNLQLLQWTFPAKEKSFDLPLLQELMQLMQH